MDNTVLASYKLTKTVLTNEDNIRYVTYGMEASSIQNGQIVLDEIVDISTNRSFVIDLVKQFNDLNLSMLHFRDAVYDAVCKKM